MEKDLFRLDGKTLNNILKAIKEINDTAVMKINPDGIDINALAERKDALARVFLPNYYLNGACLDYKKEFGFDVKAAYDALKSFNKTDITVLLDDKALIFQVNSFRLEFPILEVESFPIEKLEGSVNFDNYVTVESKALNQVISILKQRKAKDYYGSKFTISLSEKGLEIVYVNTDTQEKLNFNFIDYDSHLIAKNVKEAVSSSYSIERILKILGKKEFSEFTRIHIAPKEQILKVVYPLDFSYTTPEIAYYLARQVQE